MFKLIKFISLRHQTKKQLDPARTLAQIHDKNLPSISVVTVCLNASDCLQKTLDSVLSQDYPLLEYIVLDGGSTDGTLDIIQANADRLSYWKSEPDRGVYFAMNDAIQYCSNDWILFMNAGDTFAGPDSLMRLMRLMPGGTDVVYGHHIYVNGRRKERRFAADFELTWSRLLNGQLQLDWLLGIPGHQATAMRKSLLEQLRFDTSFRIAADHDVLFRARQGGAKFFNCNEMISIYVGDGYSANNYDLCKKEWLLIAERYGPPDKAREFYARLDAANWFSKMRKLLAIDGLMRLLVF